MACPLCQTKDTVFYLHAPQAEMAPRDYHQCSQCSLIFVLPEYRLSSEQEKERYDQHNNDSEDVNYVAFLERLTQPLQNFVSLGSKGLDFGCGPGPTIAKILNKQGFVVENYDPFYFSGQTVLQHDYDFVTCSEVIEHVYDPKLVFSLFERLLKKRKGVLGVMTRFFSADENFMDWWYRKDPTHVCFYSQKTFQWLADAKGWTALFPTDNVVIFKDF